MVTATKPAGRDWSRNQKCKAFEEGGTWANPGQLLAARLLPTPSATRNKKVHFPSSAILAGRPDVYGPPAKAGIRHPTFSCPSPPPSPPFNSRPYPTPPSPLHVAAPSTHHWPHTGRVNRCPQTRYRMSRSQRLTLSHGTAAVWRRCAGGCGRAHCRGQQLSQWLVIP